ncbi:energy-coupling factor ABC transporter permease [Caldicoprobacter faecalis]|uniref:Cobalt/nickel transport system permease protein n=1 Tax=Caldicoprobacter faecalis TaxID=937334 RepID=A0A1I5SGL5_9FIRM|nr:energy-coupling factor ABC transporter permease [Caldicoprobacter faecalis]SFP69855.1 cobalt/nickel transport system permease protein [Caldicoprobacter faecalis]
MHMADALISPAVGGTMLAATAGIAAYSAKKVQNDMDESKIPLMGVMGAFVFAAQMINFSIPGTGSSGHLGGGMLLAILLGPYAGFLTMASILLIQALFFGDGGLLAYGCNVFNLGFYTCFVAYPLIYKKLVRKGVNPRSIFVGSMVSSMVGLQLGAFSVVVQTLLSGKTELPFGQFLLLMQPIHLAIGVIEGLATAAIVTFIWRARPEILERVAFGKSLGGVPIKKVLTGLVVAVVIVGGLLSWFASTNPDGLEWSIERVAGTAELETPDGIHKIFSEIQSKTAFLPDYGFKTDQDDVQNQPAVEDEEAWPSVDAGTSVSGIVGGAMTLVLAAFMGWIINISKKKRGKAVV